MKKKKLWSLWKEKDEWAFYAGVDTVWQSGLKGKTSVKLLVQCAHMLKVDMNLPQKNERKRERNETKETKER